MMEDQFYNSRPLSRDAYLRLLRAALGAQHYRFAREAAIAWLANFPGDLMAGLYYSKVLIGEGRFYFAQKVLRGLFLADAHFFEAAQELLHIENLLGGEQNTSPTVKPQQVIEKDKTAEAFSSGVGLQTCLFALTGRNINRGAISPWGSNVWLARQALHKGDLERARTFLEQVVSEEIPSPLVCVTHLHLLSLDSQVNTVDCIELAERYHRLWPDNVECMIFLADWLMGSDESERAVILLHQAASRDVGGQVVRRILGNDHPYLRMWPDQLELTLRLPVPVDVAVALGWNQLNQGEIPVEVTEMVPAEDQELLSEPVERETTYDSVPVLDEETREEPVATEPALPPAAPASFSQKEGAIEKSELVHRSDLHTVRREMERMAVRMKSAGLTRMDKRFPVYVVFSVRSRLEAIYGQKNTQLLEAEMERLVKAVHGRRGWGARLYFADEPACTKALGIKCACPSDAWELKLSLRDLDAALAKKGEMIGAVLIVGGPDVIPFHHLPNPVDDQDTDVPSDNPYATRDENYFVPEWPVGRLPSGEGKEPKLILEALRRFSSDHLARTRQKNWGRRLIQRLSTWLKWLDDRRRSNFGYTAAVWKQAASSVFRPIGKPSSLRLSPPLGIKTVLISKEMAVARQTGDGVPTPEGRLGYFNLHGLVDTPEWFGHRDPFEPGDGPDYPIALRPQDIATRRRLGGSRTPQVVFSEACYGLHIQGRSIEEAISLKFLEAGSLAVAGSTCMSYGSIGEPLIAADLLGRAFWRYLLEGMPAGEALRQAKILLTDEMHRRQGYLDGEDQKTLISFILYGDPLAQITTNGRKAKCVRYREQPLGQVRTVCDRVEGAQAAQPIPAEVVASVRQVVSRYLPGMSDARLALTSERDVCNGQSHCCPTSQLAVKRGLEANKKSEKKESAGKKPSHRLITLSKEVAPTEVVHHEFARLTLDAQGNLVKLVVSR